MKNGKFKSLVLLLTISLIASLVVLLVNNAMVEVEPIRSAPKETPRQIRATPTPTKQVDSNEPESYNITTTPMPTRVVDIATPNLLIQLILKLLAGYP